MKNYNPKELPKYVVLSKKDYDKLCDAYAKAEDERIKASLQIKIPTERKIKKIVNKIFWAGAESYTDIAILVIDEWERIRSEE